MQKSVVKVDERNKDITITFDTEQDRIKGVAMLMRTAEWFKTINKNRFVIKKKELGIFENNNIKYSQIK
jgi:hypothetical protein